MRKKRFNEAPFWRERDPQPTSADAETHERLSTPISIERLGGPLGERRHGGDAKRGIGRAAGSSKAFSGRASRFVSYKGYLSIPQVCARLHVSRFTLWRMVKRGEFIASVQLGRRVSVWDALAVNEWCRTNAAHFERVLSRHRRPEYRAAL